MTPVSLPSRFPGAPRIAHGPSRPYHGRDAETCTEIPFAHLTHLQAIRRIYNRVSTALGLPVGVAQSLVRMPGLPSQILRAQQLTFVLLDDYIEVSKFEQAWRLGSGTHSVGERARMAHRRMMQQQSDEGDAYRRVYESLREYITEQLSV